MKLCIGASSDPGERIRRYLTPPFIRNHPIGRPLRDLLDYVKNKSHPLRMAFYSLATPEGVEPSLPP